MKEFILLKEGVYAIDAFADVMEHFNDFDNERLQYFTRTQVSVLLHANVSDIDPTHKIALSHFSVDPLNPPVDPQLFKPFNADTLKQAADEYGIVIVATTIETGTVGLADNNIISDSTIIVRDTSDRLVIFETGEYLTGDGTHQVNVVPFFVVVRLQGLPVYYLITDSSLVKIGDGFGFEHGDTSFRQLTESDGYLKDNMFIPTVNAGNELIGTNIFCTTDVLDIDFFEHPQSLFASTGMTNFLGDVEFDIKSNFNFNILANRITVDVSAEVGYIKVLPRLGRFVDEADVENIEFNFSIFKIK